MTKTISLLLLCAGLASAADAVAEAQTALAGNEAAAKKSALKALANKSAGDDAVVIPLLLGALADRQAGEAAASILRSRTGSSPKGGTWIPGKEEQTVKAWTEWWATEQQKRQVQELQKKAKGTTKDKAQDVVPAKPEAEEKTEVKAPRAVVLPDDLGKIDRIILKAGGSMLCYIQSRRTDAEGNLVSLRIIHPESGGEEILGADLISRVDEDVR